MVHRFSQVPKILNVKYETVGINIIWHFQNILKRAWRDHKRKNLWAACQAGLTGEHITIWTYWPVSAGKPMRRSGQFWQTAWSSEWRSLLCWWEGTCRRLSGTDRLTILADWLVYWTTDLRAEPARWQFSCNRTCFVRDWKCDSIVALLSVINFLFWLRRVHQGSLFLHLTWGLENIKGSKSLWSLETSIY